jgi:hypothetical protein
MYNDCRKWLEAGGALPSDDLDLAYELAAPETVARIDGKIQLESKKEMKARGLQSPNRADALVLSFAFPVTDTANMSLIPTPEYNDGFTF